MIEVIVALMVLATSALGVAGVMSWAADQLRRTEGDEALVSVAESVLDSLLADETPAAGSRRVGTGIIDWTVEASRRSLALQMHLRFADSARTRDLHIVVTRMAPPPIAAGQ